MLSLYKETTASHWFGGISLMCSGIYKFKKKSTRSVAVAWSGRIRDFNLYPGNGYVSFVFCPLLSLAETLAFFWSQRSPPLCSFLLFLSIVSGFPFRRLIHGNLGSKSLEMSYMVKVNIRKRGKNSLVWARFQVALCDFRVYWWARYQLAKHIGNSSTIPRWEIKNRRCPYHFSLLCSISSIMILSACIILLISVFRILSIRDFLAALFQKSISTVVSLLACCWFIVHTSDPYNTMLSWMDL